jgi:hypothetical protein
MRKAAANFAVVLFVGCVIMMANSVSWAILLSIVDQPKLMAIIEYSKYFPAWIAVGIVLWVMRVRFPKLYGFFELYFSLHAIAYATQIAGDLETKTLSLSGGIYILVRGLNNIYRGLKGKYLEWANYLIDKPWNFL